jgi:hypothetical protein
VEPENHTPTASSPATWDRIRSICAEYLDMPGLRLTPEQAQRLWGLDRDTCADLLNSLIEIAFLRRTRDGRYARADRLRQPGRRRHPGPRR